MPTWRSLRDTCAGSTTPRSSPPSINDRAQTFKDTIERTLNPRMKSPYAQQYGDIMGAAAYIAGKATHISGIVVRGDELRIHLVAPAPDFLSRIAEPAMCARVSTSPWPGVKDET